MPTVFAYSPPVLEAYPTIRGGAILVAGLANGPAPPGLADRYEAEQQAVRARLAGVPLSAVPSLAAWRIAFRAFGTDPTKYRSAAESLLRRLTKKGDVPSINLAVDAANLVSIRHALPVAVFDRHGVAGSLTVRFATGDEPFADLGSEGESTPAPGEVVFVDEDRVVAARRWCWRQSRQSAAGPTTTEALITVEGHHDAAAADVGQAVADLEGLLAEFAPGTRLDSAALGPERPAR